MLSISLIVNSNEAFRALSYAVEYFFNQTNTFRVIEYEASQARAKIPQKWIFPRNGTFCFKSQLTENLGVQHTPLGQKLSQPINFASFRPMFEKFGTHLSCWETYLQPMGFSHMAKTPFIRPNWMPKLRYSDITRAPTGSVYCTIAFYSNVNYSV